MQWFNIIANVPYTLPLPVDAKTGARYDFAELSRRYSSECARIELQMGDYPTAPLIDVPAAVIDEYRKYRPTPLCRARGLEKALDYTGKIYFKREDVCPGGSYKPNTGLPQAYYGKQDGLSELIADTGAGQWGVALAYACRRFGLESTIFMTRKSFDDKPYHAHFIKLAGGTLHASPSDQTRTGRKLLKDNPQHPGTVGVGMAEAMELVMRRGRARLALGCMSYYAAMHQSVIGMEVKETFDELGERPDIMLGCVGGGTNFMGFTAPLLAEKIAGKNETEFVAVESADVPVLTTGAYNYDYQDYSGLTPKVKMYTLGHEFMAPEISSGGLRYHGRSPILSLLFQKGHVRATTATQSAAFAAGQLFFQCEGILMAPETGHAVAQLIKEVERAKQEGVKRTLCFCLSGNGFLDLKGYDDHGKKADVGKTVRSPARKVASRLASKPVPDVLARPTG